MGRVDDNGRNDDVLIVFQKNPIGEYTYVYPAYVKEEGVYTSFFRIASGVNRGTRIDYSMCASSNDLLSKLQSKKGSSLSLTPFTKFDVNNTFAIVIGHEIEQYVFNMVRNNKKRDPIEMEFIYSLMVVADKIGRSIEKIDKKTFGSYVADIKPGFDKLGARQDFAMRHFINPKPNNVATAEAGVGEKSTIEKTKKNISSVNNSIPKKDVKQSSDVLSDIQTISKTDSSMQKSITSVNVSEIKAEIKKKVIGQDRAIDAVVNNIYFNQKYIDTGDRDLLRNKANIILDGSTGTGKTFILDEVADKLNLPIVITGVTNYSSVGYKGASLDDILVRLLDKAQGDLELAERGIVAFDEFDKLGGFADNDIAMRKAMQQELLTFISGNKYDVIYKNQSYTFDTSKLTFIGMGAFTKLRERKIKDNEKKYKASIGFSTHSDEEIERHYTITKDDYVSEGLERELVGRFPCLTYTNDLGVKDLERILTESITSPLEGLRITGNIMGCKIVVSPEMIHDIAQRAFDTNTGARGLIEIVQSLKDVISNDLFSGKEEIVITSEHLDKINSVHERTYQARKVY